MARTTKVTGTLERGFYTHEGSLRFDALDDPLAPADIAALAARLGLTDFDLTIKYEAWVSVIPGDHETPTDSECNAKCDGVAIVPWIVDRDGVKMGEAITLGKEDADNVFGWYEDAIREA